MSSYESVIGLEVHVQIRTESKMFCSCANSYGAEPNTLLCPVCMGHPGVMPAPNRQAVRKTILAGFACGCDIPRYSKFDRKSYFYPDMPKNYQISQYDLPFCLNGSIPVSGRGFSGLEMNAKDIGITRIHLEEDVAKSTHFEACSGIDFNRAGVPLMEIVSEPDMRTADEAYAYLTSLKQRMQYARISDCDMEKGQMRCDVNISLRPAGQKEFGTKIEIKNLNSFKAVHRSLEYEIERQGRILESGSGLEQETRGWDDDLGETYLLRAKESAHDYRYFPEPDLMPIVFADEELEEIRSSLPELPGAMRSRFIEDLGLTEYDAEVLTQDKTLADYFESAVGESSNPKLFANWIISELLGELSSNGTSIDECPVTASALAELVGLIEKGTISGKIAKKVFAEMFISGKRPGSIVEEKGLVQVSDEKTLESWVEEAISSNPSQVEEYRAGKSRVIQFFVGQVMKMSRSKANPQMVIKLLKERLDSGPHIS